MDVARILVAALFVLLNASSGSASRSSPNVSPQVSAHAYSMGVFRCESSGINLKLAHHLVAAAPAVNSSGYDGCEFASGSFVEILFPLYGDLAHQRLEVGIEVHQIQSHIDHLNFDAIGVISISLPLSTELIESKNRSVDPGSMFFSVSTVGADQTAKSRAHGYLEFILADAEIIKQRRYATERGWLPNSISSPIASDDSGTHDGTSSMVNVCFFGADLLDGQRRIWLTQTQHMNSSQFTFTWILGTASGANVPLATTTHGGNSSNGASNGGGAGLRDLLRGMGDKVVVLESPGFPIDRTELADDPGDGSPSASVTWGGDVENLFLYAHQRLQASDYSIEEVRPLWCRRIFQAMRTVLLQRPCTVVVYGNTRLEGDRPGGDLVITDTARALGIPSVAELMNLFVSTTSLPDVIVAPSHYALEHESVQSALVADSAESIVGVTGGRPPVGMVIAPAVDTFAFDPARFRGVKGEKEMYVHPGCSHGGSLGAPTRGSAVFPCVVVGFVARLAPEKSPGLFLQMAHHLLLSYPFARFTVVGAGVLRASLEGLAARLGISWAVHFAGWVGAEQLPAVLAGIDIVVNPSLRAWSETFCIANVEAMSMKVPLVTFAVGGVGEYVAQPAERSEEGEEALSEGERRGDYSVSANAVVVHRASPAALAGAVEHLILHPQLRRALGEEARRTVLNSFSVERQMRQYADFYQHIVK